MSAFTAAREWARLQEAAAAVRAASEIEPRTAFVLGTGLGGLAQAIEVEAEIPYEDLPHFPRATVESHRGRLLLGSLEGVPVVAMQGRPHRYEGWSLREVVFPVRVMKLLGAEVLLLSAACGGMNPLWAPGDLVMLRDHVNLLGDSPLVGPNLDALGPRFPDMSAPYDPELRRAAAAAALAQGVALREGVYVAVAGPQLETRAEYRMLRALGADVVGMSTVPEVIAARHMGMRVLALAVVTDQCLPDALQEVDLAQIVAVAAAAEPTLTRLATAVVAGIAAPSVAPPDASPGPLAAP